MLPTELFLSHSSQDQIFVAPLVGMLRRHGVPVWYSPTNILGAQQWHDEIGAALKRCDWFSIVLSPQAIASTWVKRETVYALNDRRYDNRIVPLLYQPCAHDDFSWTLGSLQFVDFTQQLEDGYRQLLRTWGLGYQL